MLSTLDFIVLIGYIVAVIWFGLRFSGTQESTTDYFLGGRDLPWWAVCLSIVATETSTLTVIGIPAVAFGGTLTFLQLTIGYLLGRILVSIFFLPKYMSGDLVTAYAFLGKRFGPQMQTLSSLTFIGTRLLADGVRLFATAIPLKVIADAAGLDIGYPVIIVGIGLLTIVYTYFGGLKAVVWMDAVQMILYLVAAVGSILFLVSALDASAWSTLVSSGKLQILNFGQEGLRSIITEPYVFWTAVIGGGVFSMASHGTDHLIVQRLLACRNLRDSQKALVGSAFVVMVQFVLFLLIGSLLWVYYGGVGFAELGLSRGDEIFPKFIIDGLPPGVSGLVLAGILAAAMSTLSSSLNALASSTLMDVLSHVKWWKISPESELKASRWLTLFWGIVFMFFATLFEDRQSPVVELGLSIASFTYGALLGAFLLGMLNKRAQQADAIFSFTVSVFTMILIIFGLWLDADGSLRFVIGPSAEQVATEGLKAVAWPWYTLIGALITVGLGSLTAFRHR